MRLCETITVHGDGQNRLKASPEMTVLPHGRRSLSESVQNSRLTLRRRMRCKIIQKADRSRVVADLAPAVSASVLAVERPCGVLPAKEGGMGGMQENNRVLVEAPAVQSRQNPAEVGDAARHPHQKQLKKSVGRIRIPAVKAQKSPDRPGVADRAEDKVPLNRAAVVPHLHPVGMQLGKAPGPFEQISKMTEGIFSGCGVW